MWKCHSDSVRRFYRNKVPWAVGLDLTQRTLEACLRARDRIVSFRAYVLGVAIRQLYDHLRNEQRKQRREADLETLVIDDTIENPEEWVAAKRDRRDLLRALRRLPLPRQVLLELHFWEGLSATSIAQILDWPRGTVKTRLAAARVALRAEVEALRASPDDHLSTMDDLDAWAARTHKHVLSPSGERSPLSPPAALARGSGPIELSVLKPAPADADDDDSPLPPLPLERPGPR